MITQTNTPIDDGLTLYARTRAHTRAGDGDNRETCPICPRRQFATFGTGLDRLDRSSAYPCHARSTFHAIRPAWLAGFHVELEAQVLQGELAAARREIAELRRKASGAGGDAAFERGFQAGQRYGTECAAADLREQAFRRVKTLEAELEAYRAPLDWPDLAERLYVKFRRGLKAPFAKGLLYRASTNKHTPTVQAELRAFAATNARKAKRAKGTITEHATA